MFEKKLQNALFWGPFGPNTSKGGISAKNRLSFLRYKNNATSLKKPKEV